MFRAYTLYFLCPCWLSKKTVLTKASQDIVTMFCTVQLPPFPNSPLSVANVWTASFDSCIRYTFAYGIGMFWITCRFTYWQRWVVNGSVENCALWNPTNTPLWLKFYLQFQFPLFLPLFSISPPPSCSPHSPQGRFRKVNYILRPKYTFKFHGWDAWYFCTLGKREFALLRN